MRLDRGEAEARVVLGANLGEQQRDIRAVAGGPLEHAIDQLPRGAATAMRRLREDRAEARDANRPGVERRVEAVHLQARQHRVDIDADLVQIETSHNPVLGKPASQHCGGCHDMPLMIDGLMTSADAIPAADLRAHSGVTCRLCHGIQSTAKDGNGSYVWSRAPIEAPSLGDAASIARHKAQTSVARLGTELCVGCHRGFLSADMNMPHGDRSCGKCAMLPPDSLCCALAAEARAGTASAPTMSGSHAIAWT